MHRTSSGGTTDIWRVYQLRFELRDSDLQYVTTTCTQCWIRYLCDGSIADFWICDGDGTILMLVVEVQRMRSQEYPVIRIQLQNQSNITTHRAIMMFSSFSTKVYRIIQLGDAYTTYHHQHSRNSTLLNQHSPIPSIYIVLWVVKSAFQANS